MHKLAYALFLASLASLIACDNEISSAARLRRARLLAVQAEPPNPAFGQTTRLRPLVYLPPGEDVTYAWSWCPVPTRSEDGYACPLDQAALDNLAVLAGLTGLPPLFLGNTETIDFINPFPPNLLAGLCAGDATTTGVFLGNAREDGNQRVYACAAATLPVQVMLTIRGSITETGVGSLRLPIDATTPGNHNPVISDVRVLSPEPERVLDDTGLVTVPRDHKVKLRASVEPTQAELYLDRQLGPQGEYLRDDTGQYILGPTTEGLTVFWYSEGGGFVERRTGWSARDRGLDGNPLALSAAIENEWLTPKIEDYAGPTSLVLVVVQDSRGGVAWARGTAALETAP